MKSHQLFARALALGALMLLSSSTAFAQAEDSEPTEQSTVQASQPSSSPSAKKLPAQTIEDFARAPLLQHVQLSPDGKQIAAVLNQGKLSVLVTRPVKGGTFKQLMASDNLEYQFNWLRWVNADRLVVSLRYPSTRQVSWFSSADSMESRLLAVNADGSRLINLSRMRGQEDIAQALDQAVVIDWLADDGHHILMSQPNAKFSGAPAVFKVNVDTGARQLLRDSMNDILTWVTDAQHRVRVGVSFTEGRQSLWVSDPEGKTWRLARSFGLLDSARITPLGFGLDPQTLYVIAMHEGFQAIHTMDLSDPALPLSLKFQQKASRDLDGHLLYSSKTGEAVGFVSNGQNAGAYFWSEDHKALVDRIDKALPKRANRIVQLVDQDDVYLLRSFGNGKPGEYMVGQRSKGALAVLAELNAQLDPEHLALKRSIRFKARDGLPLQAYLSLPRGVPSKGLPLVVLPHGGPQASTGSEFETWPAFLAERGYAVLQVNFRGSTGFGQAFMEAGLKRWGLEMQDDLSDGVAELVKRGTVDPQRVAIVGASYGGYAALMGVVKAPQQYRGAFAFAPLTDLVEYAREIANNRVWISTHALERQIGSLASDRARLEATSPRLQAAKIEVPVVLVHGTLDRQTPYEHSVWMADALKAAGKDYRFISQDRGDHQLSHQPYHLQLLQELDAFLLKVLGPGAMPQAKP
ncbi:S9 family peptidase [Roseateles oligotrophus]|uniref:Prolyl oligopeptidase family serine peptidase n=1 Tax=Roseateles oligotrophus TaxID=1769250 RepID=A0ABT2YAE6_9BURK|nr:prolyl oligopeptidase family serine peptidase [Roseateles oligotrophus]MCV2367274.1 prolyl oligopeptidase family serine peptidase [Roseateles oligotrophus]